MRPGTQPPLLMPALYSGRLSHKSVFSSMHIGRKARIAQRARSTCSAGWPIALWATVFILLLRNTVFIRHRDTSLFATIDAPAFLDVTVVISTALLLLAQGDRLLCFLKQHRHSSLGLFLGFQTLCILSSIWSSSPLYSAFRATQVMVEVLAVVLAFSYAPDFFRCEKRLLQVSVAIVLVSIIAQVRYGVSLAALHTNSYSASAAMLCCYCAGELPRARQSRRRWLAICGTISLLAVAVGTSSGSNIALVCGFFVLLASGYGKLSSLAALSLVISLTLMPLMLSAFDFTTVLGPFQQLLFPGKSAQAVLDMTGRRALWEHTLDRGLDRPLLGYGFAISSWTSDFVITNSEHNLVLAVFLATGGVGLVLFTAWFFKCSHELLKAIPKRTTGSRGCFGALVVAMVNCMSAPFLSATYAPPLIVITSILALQYAWTLSGPRRQMPTETLLVQPPPLVKRGKTTSNCIVESPAKCPSSEREGES